MWLDTSLFTDPLISLQSPSSAATVIKYKPQGIYWQPTQRGSALVLARSLRWRPRRCFRKDKTTSVYRLTWYQLSRYETNQFTTWELAPMVLSFSSLDPIWPRFCEAPTTEPCPRLPLSRLSSMSSVKWARAVYGWEFRAETKLIWSNLFADKNSYSCWCTPRTRILLVVGSTVIGQ